MSNTLPSVPEVPPLTLELCLTALMTVAARSASRRALAHTRGDRAYDRDDLCLDYLAVPVGDLTAAATALDALLLRGEEGPAIHVIRRSLAGGDHEIVDGLREAGITAGHGAILGYCDHLEERAYEAQGEAA